MKTWSSPLRVPFAVVLFAIVLLLSGSFLSVQAVAAQKEPGPGIEVVSGSGIFELVGGAVTLRARVKDDPARLEGREVTFWVTQDPSRPCPLKRDDPTPSSFLIPGLPAPVAGEEGAIVLTDSEGVAEITYRLGSRSGHYIVLASVEGLVGQPAQFTIQAGLLPILVITLLGGLGMFIFGMNMMGNSLQTWAGDRMRSVLGFFTKNRVVGMFSGIVITFLMQSSSASTVLLVGFVNSGLMSLAQTIGVILGADIGTTLTVQIIAFDVGQFALAFVFLGFVFIFFTKKPALNYLGQVLIGFGLLFYGLKVMGDSMSPLSRYQPFADALFRSTANPLSGLLISTLLTALIQSSAATIAIAIGLALQVGPDGGPLLSLVQAIPIIFGANIGTTITAGLACIGTTRNAKRVAIAHTFFKIAGVVIFMFFIGPLARVTGSLGGTINRQIANAHTIFNVGMALIFIPFTTQFGALIMKILPREAAKEEKFKPVYLVSDLTKTPAIALEQTKKELLRMGEIAVYMVENIGEAFKRKDREFVDKLIQENGKIEILEKAVRAYLAEIGAGELSLDSAQRSVRLMNISNEYWEVGKTVSQDILPLTEAFIEKNMYFSPEGWTQLQDYHARVAANLKEVTAAFREENTALAEEITQRKPSMIRMEKEYTKAHFDRLSKGMAESVETSTLHMGLIGGLRRINSYATNIAYAVMGQV